MKKCPYRAEEIQDETIKCRFCGEFLVLFTGQGSEGMLKEFGEAFRAFLGKILDFSCCNAQSSTVTF